MNKERDMLNCPMYIFSKKRKDWGCVHTTDTELNVPFHINLRFTQAIVFADS